MTLLMTAIFTIISVQSAYASALAGKATVNEGYTTVIELADTYQRTLRQSTGITYQWRSEDNSCVTITSSTKYEARIKGVAPTSSCRVYYKCSYFIDGFYRTMDFYYDVTVIANTVKVTRVEISQSSATMTEGSTLQLSATAYPTNATNRRVNWSSDRNTVATVSSNGLVTAKSAGTATITCYAADGSGCKASCRITVEAVVKPTDISLSHTSATITEGETLQLTATISPDDATETDLTWLSDNPAVATVGSDGLVTANGAGTANIIVTTANDLAAVCAITVTPQGASIDETTIHGNDAAPFSLAAGSITFAEATDVALYRIDGTLAHSGTTQRIDGLDSGIYILTSGNRSWKIAIK